MHYRTIFISDLHLGTRGCQAEALLEFLKDNESDYLYLIGDIFDGWQLRKKWYWPQAHNDIVQKLLRKARKGCKTFRRSRVRRHRRTTRSCTRDRQWKKNVGHPWR
jgi:UDP-2,3-diacylglucosamine pyrophosphatase LpxH